MSSIDAHVSEYQEIWPDGTSSGVPMVFGEHNSLYNQGKPGLSNSFGAALWGVDFNLYAASVGVRRVHMHMGTDYRVSFFLSFFLWYTQTHTHVCVCYSITSSFAARATRPAYYAQTKAQEERSMKYESARS